jgi:sulfur carrier protein
VLGLVENLQLNGQRLAIEVNLEIVPRSRYGEYQLADGDRVEIVNAIGGG